METAIKVLIQKWYNSKTIKYELIKQFKNKEVIFLGQKKINPKSPNIRWLRIHNTQTLEKQYKNFNFFKYAFNIYHSLAYYKNLPILSLIPQQRKIEQQELNEEINKNITKEIYAIDFALDFDSENLNYALLDVEKVKRDLDRFKIPYQLKFSGKKGFHILISYKVMPDLPDVEYYITFYKLIIERLIKHYKIPTLDISIYDLKRIFKTAYSIDIRTNKVVMPLTSYELEHFKIDDYDIRNFDYLIKMAYKKGQYWNNIKNINDYNEWNKAKERFKYWINHIDKL